MFYLDLPLHCYTEEGDEIHNQYRPEYRNIKTIEKCTKESYNCTPCNRVPKFEFW